MKGITLLLTCLVYCANIGPIRANSPKVCLDGSSCVLGRFMSGNVSGSFEAFLGIPYAKPPIGDLRFSNPEEAELWNGTLSAINTTPDCIQRDYINVTKRIGGSEDCLYLNIYRPLNNTGRELPVMFFIHGGGFFTGSPSPNNVGPQYFMDTGDVILVVAAYRLGPFGFLSTNDEEMTGNFGLKDQKLALKWVKNYISAFGGDPDRVTIFGHSAGGASVHLHLMNNNKEDLFSKAIMMSGVGNSPFALPVNDPRDQVVQLAKAAGVTEAENLSSADLVQALRSIKPEDLLIAADDLKIWAEQPLVIFRPNIENDTWPGAFLTKDPMDPFIPLGTNTDIPWFIGNAPAKGEGLVIALRLASNKSLQDELNEDFIQRLSITLSLSGTCDTEAVIDALVTEYMDGKHELNNDTLNGFLELLGDRYFIHPTYRVLKSNVNSSRSDFRGILRFDYRGPYSYSPYYTNSSIDFGTAHYDDTLFLFDGPVGLSNGYSQQSPEAALVKRYVRLYQSFAENGYSDEFAVSGECNDLNFPNCENLLIVKDEEPFQTGDSWNSERMGLWDQIYDSC
ncbi:cholinesterase 1-like [Bactrocera tryoni]|uniref:cholinesterase 1-like n=1 Tax=Bactrocera tryoni TaxID=59916 RepID=UPI001A9599D0|nr:cholinesterase 1-like [Bactrocera tryoni]